MSGTLTRLGRWERAVEFRLGPIGRSVFRMLVTLLVNLVMLLFVMGSVGVVEIVSRSLFKGDEIRIFGDLPFHYVFEITEIAVMLVFLISIVVSSVRSLQDVWR
jgi:hypothetical protein